MKNTKAWCWIPTLYFAEGLPYVAVMTLSVIMYKRLDVSNTDIALFTSWLYFPWVIKPLWSPFVDLLRTKRWWIYVMQLFVGAGMAGVAFVLPGDFFFRATLAFFWLMAFSSATHDIAADGFYMLGLTEEQQALLDKWQVAQKYRDMIQRMHVDTINGMNKHYTIELKKGYINDVTGSRLIQCDKTAELRRIIVKSHKR